ncbi:MAG: hypothetical protein JST63_07725 [Bacteroidetes bacterium]|nr:hypothetical protein [Bacteroidota bacterium]
MTAIGQPTYDNVNKSINIDSRINGNQYEGAEYRITSTFKQGYSYVITVTAARIMSQQTGPNVLLRLDMNNGGSRSNTNCDGTGVIDANGSGGLKKSSEISSNSFSDYVFTYSALSAQQAYLMIAAIPPVGSVPQTILIRKINIIETPPGVTFTLSPSSSTINCGSITQKTFTVTNVNNMANVTNHLWNLGANNGWLYNGNPAPQTISTGTTNNVTLTPACSNLKNNISVTVTAGGNNYQTNTAAITNTSPSLSISGSNAFCSGTSSYSISNIPCNATVSWISSNTSIATISSTGNPATVTKVGNGSVTITATINDVACLVNNVLSKTISIGTPQSGNISIWNSANSTSIGQPVGFVAGYPPNNRCQIIATNWQVISMSANITSGDFPCANDNGTSKNIFFSINRYSIRSGEYTKRLRME